jgi:preprotein translocase subunit YajC
MGLFCWGRVRICAGGFMAKIDEVKEMLNTLRTLLSLLSAFMIATAGALGTLFQRGDIGALFWSFVFLMVLFILVSFAVIRKIKQKTKEIGEL